MPGPTAVHRLPPRGGPSCPAMTASYTDS